MEILEVQIPELVTDRTLEDVEAENEKGTYNVADLNRVETTVEILSERMQTLEEDLRALAEEMDVEWSEEFELTFEPIEAMVNVRTDWTIPDLPNRRQMRRYLRNIIRICTLLEMDDVEEELPADLRFLTYQGANKIEEILERAARALNRLIHEKVRLIAGIKVPVGHLIYVPIGSQYYYSPEAQIYCCLKGPAIPLPSTHLIYQPYGSMEYETADNENTLLCRKEG